MGGNVSKTSSKINSKILNESVFEFVSKNMTSTSQGATVKQEISLKDADLKCRAEITNKATVDLKLLQQINDQQTISMVDAITNELKNQSETKGTQENGFLSTAIANTNKSSSEITNEVETKIRKEISTESINEIVQTVNAKQGVEISGLKIDPCGLELFYKYSNGAPPGKELMDCQKDAECKIGNDILVQLAAEQIVQKVVDTIQEMKLETKTDTKAKTTGEQANKGLSVWMILAVVIGLMVVAFIIYMVRSSMTGGH